jgi:hypothetical protein
LRRALFFANVAIGAQAALLITNRLPMNHPKLLALLAALCMSQGCIIAGRDVTSGEPATGQGQVVADMGDALDQSTSPDLSAPDLDPSPDQGGEDMAPEEMGPDGGEADMACSAAAQCAALMIECGQTLYPDECARGSAEPVLLDCGGCEARGDKSSCQENKCEDHCTPREDSELCQPFACGAHRVTDCGVEQDITCPDTCDATAEVCLQDGTCCDRQQQQQPARQALVDAGRCGQLQAIVCEREETISIDPSCDEYATIMNKEEGYYQCDNGLCVCRPESDQELCDKLSRRCGPIPSQTRDRCDRLRQGFNCAERCVPVLQRCCRDRGVCVGSLSPC